MKIADLIALLQEVEPLAEKLVVFLAHLNGVPSPAPLVASEPPVEPVQVVEPTPAPEVAAEATEVA